MIEKKCAECGSSFSVNNSRVLTALYCSKSCHGRATFSRRKITSIYKICETCGGQYLVRKNEIEKRRTCSKKCLGRLQSKERKGSQTEELSYGWKGGIQTYRRKMGDKCNRCGSNEKLLVHHIDENRYNNRDENLETLCRRCHQIHHNCISHLQPNTEEKCLCCNSSYIKKNHRQKYCSKKCLSMHKDFGTATCPQCLKEFKKSQDPKVCCSKSCSNRYRHKNP